MSFKLLSQVWGKELGRAEQTILLAMADYADDDGRNCYPSYERLAWKTGYSSRQVGRIIKDLLAQGVLVITKPATQHRPPVYWIRLDAAKDKPPYRESVAAPDEFGAAIQGGQNVVSESQGGHFVIPDTTFCQPRVDKMSYQPISEPIIEPTNGEKSPPPFDFNRGLPAPRQAKRDADHAAAQRNKLGLSAKELTALTDAILDRNGKRAVADLETDMGEAELRYARECALSLAAMGHKTPDAIDVLFATWRTHDWRGQKGELPDYRQLVTHAAALPGKVKAAPTLSKEERERQVGRAKLALSTIRTDEKLGHKPSPRDLKIVEDARALGII